MGVKPRQFESPHALKSIAVENYFYIIRISITFNDKLNNEFSNNQLCVKINLADICHKVSVLFCTFLLLMSRYLLKG